MHFFMSWVGEEVAKEDIATHKVCAAKKSKTAKTKCVLFQKTYSLLEKKNLETRCAIRDISIRTATNISKENFLEYERKHLCQVTFKGMTVNIFTPSCLHTV